MDTTIRARLALRSRWALALFVLASCLSCGCKSDPATNPFARTTEEDTASEQLAAENVEGPFTPVGRGTPADREMLVSDGWHEQVLPPFAVRDETFRRWRHHEIDRLINCPPASRPDLSAALADADPHVSANAAIVLAHWGSGQGIARLVETARDVSVRPAMRSAAVEALGVVCNPSPAPAIRELLTQFAPLEDAPLSGPPPADLHADLVRALARHARPGDEAHFTAALRSQAWNVRYEGMLAWGGLRGMELPGLALDRRTDLDSRVRAAALRSIASHGDAHALEYCQTGLNDASIDVHMAAISALGLLGTSEAADVLQKLKSHRSELSRAAALVALAATGARDEIEAAARDDSQHVRLAVAELLGDFTRAGQQVAAHTVDTAKGLVRDASQSVQRRSIESLAGWPLEQAGPVLLLAIGQGGYTARKEAAAELARRWPPAIDFPVDGTPQRQEIALAELKWQWIGEFGDLEQQVAEVKNEVKQTIALAADRVGEVRSLIASLQNSNLPEQARRDAIATLKTVGPALLPIVEIILAEQTGLPPEVFEEILPAISATFVLLERMRSPDMMQRRAAAEELAGQAISSQLSPLAARRLSMILQTERDPLVWKNALAAVANDASEQAITLAYMAIGNAAVDVRRKACEYLGAHGQRRHAAVLIPALDDPDATVVLSAVRALGAVGTLDDPRRLVQVLNLPDKQIRLEAAISLTRLKKSQGAAALERLALDTDLEIRLRAAQAMGEVCDPTFVPALMAMLTDKADVARVAMLSLARIARFDPCSTRDGSVLSHDEKVRQWQLWYRDHQDRTLVRAE